MIVRQEALTIVGTGSFHGKDATTAIQEAKKRVTQKNIAMVTTQEGRSGLLALRDETRRTRPIVIVDNTGPKSLKGVIALETRSRSIRPTFITSGRNLPDAIEEILKSTGIATSTAKIDWDTIAGVVTDVINPTKISRVQKEFTTIDIPPEKTFFADNEKTLFSALATAVQEEKISKEGLLIFAQVDNHPTAGLLSFSFNSQK